MSAESKSLHLSAQAPGLHPVRDLDLIDTPAEARFDRLTEDLAQQLEASIAYLALADSDRLWLKTKVGPVPTEFDGNEPLSRVTLLGRAALIVENAAQDSRFSASPLVTSPPHLRFYAGVPVADRYGNKVGVVAVAGSEPRKLYARDLAILHGYADRLAEEVNARPMVLVAYAAANRDWVTRFVRLGRTLKRHGLVDTWGSDRLAAWDSGWALKDSLFRARTVIPLISGDFLRSPWVDQKAFDLLLRIKATERVEIVPLLLEPCDWEQISWLADRATWPPGGRTLDSLSEGEVDRSLLELARKLVPGGEAAEPADHTVEPTPADLPQPEAATAVAPAVIAESAAGERLFLSHAGEDGTAVKALADRLRQAGVNVWLDLDELQPGDNWMECLEAGLAEASSFAVYIGRSGVARWINREVRVALDRNTKDPSFRFVPILAQGSDPESLPSFVAQHQWLDLRDGEKDPAKLQKLVGAILSRPAEAVPLIPPGEPPFRGLASFDSDHAHLFFGRDRETQGLIDRLSITPFLAVVGDSGSGKSSLVRAGLLPALIAGQMLDRGTPVRDWRIATLRPGARPFRQLANALLDLEVELDAAQRLEARTSISGHLSAGVDGLSDCVGALVGKGERTLIVVDQFEEVFTHASDLDERDRFIDTLLTASVSEGDRPIYVIVTLRADFYSYCFEHPSLPKAISTNQFAVRAIDREEMPDVIKKPAAMAGLKLESGLVEAILFDLGDGPGNLPLLQHTLLQLWNRRTGEILTHEAYDALGRVQGALEHHAEEVYAQLERADRRHARKLLLKLVVPGKSGENTRRRVPREELVPPGEAGEAADRVLQTLLDRRLVTMQRTIEEDREVELVEVVHEALLRSWTRLQRWLDRDREFLLWRQRLRRGVEIWEEAERDQGALLRGGPLTEARYWLGEHGSDLTEAGRRFIAESTKRARIRYWMKRAAVAVMGALAVFASWQAWQAGVERDRARTKALVEQARGRQQNRLDLALLLSLEIDRRGADLEARRLLSEGLESSPGLDRLLHGHSDDVRAVAWSPDGRWLASASGADPVLLLWDMTAEPPRAEAVAGSDEALWSVAWSPSGGLLAAAGDDGAILLWEMAGTRAGPRRLIDEVDPPKAIYALRFSPDGSSIAAARSDQRVQLWDVETGSAAPGLLAGAEDWLKAVAWSPDGSTVAAAGMDKTIRRWDVATGAPVPPALRGHDEGIMSLDWSAEGGLASGGLDGVTNVWDPTTGERRQRLADGGVGDVASVRWDASGATLLIGGTDGRIQQWKAARAGSMVPAATGQLADLLSAAWSPDGRHVASGNGSVVVLWRAAAGPRLGRAVDLGATDLRGATPNPDGRLLAAVGRDPMSQMLGIRVWERADGKLHRVLEETKREVPTLAWSDDLTLTAASGRRVRRWDVLSATVSQEDSASGDGRVTGLAWSGDAGRLALAGRDGTMSFWDWHARNTITSTDAVDGARYTSLLWNPGATTVATGHDDGTVRLWDASTAEPLHARMNAHEGRVTALAWRPDGTTLATGGDDGVVALWDGKTGALLGSPLAAHEGRVSRLAWSPDGGTLASAGEEGILLWDQARRETWAGPFRGHESTLTGLSFSPDGATLTSVGLDGRLHNWDVDVASWRRRACRVAGRDLTREEWRRYLPDSRYRKTCGLEPEPREGRTP